MVLSGTPWLMAWSRITAALLGPLVSFAAPEKIISGAQPAWYNSTPLFVRDVVSPPLTTTIASAERQFSSPFGMAGQFFISFGDKNDDKKITRATTKTAKLNKRTFIADAPLALLQ